MKKSHAAVNYRDGTATKNCANCRYMNGDHCDLVVDPIRKDGVCDLWQSAKGPRMAELTLEERKRRASLLTGRQSRAVDLVGFEMRDAGDGTWAVEGCASVTERSYSMGWYDETIARGAFNETLSRNPDVQLLLNHEGLPLARTVGGSLTLREADEGLMFRAVVDKSDPDAQRLQSKASRGLMDQCSFAFSGAKSEWDDDMTQRRITSLDIHRGDVSIVNQGANPATSFAMRMASNEEIEEWVASASPEHLELASILIAKRVHAEPTPEPPQTRSLDWLITQHLVRAQRAQG